MSQYFSKIYRGFLVEQTDRGWVVPQLPNWSNGPVSQGPYSTYQIACHVLDRVLDNSQRETSQPQKKESEPTGPEKYLSTSKKLILYLVAYPLTAIFALSTFFTFLSVFHIARNPLIFAFLAIISILSYRLSKKVIDYVYS